MNVNKENKFVLDKKEFVYIAATIAAVIAAILYDHFVNTEEV